MGGLIYARRHRERAPLHWLPIAWGAFIFMYNMTFLNVLWEISRMNPAWTWGVFGMRLVYAVLVFRSRRHGWRAAGTLAFGALSVVGWFVLFARPGDG